MHLQPLGEPLGEPLEEPLGEPLGEAVRGMLRMGDSFGQGLACHSAPSLVNALLSFCCHGLIPRLAPRTAAVVPSSSCMRRIGKVCHHRLGDRTCTLIQDFLVAA